MAGLNDYQRQRALQGILPRQLELQTVNDEISEWQSFLDFANNDLGRGMLQSPIYSLVETLPVEGIEQYKQELIGKVETGLMDDFIMTLSLKAFVRSKKEKENLCVLIPPFSYSLPLLLAYHLILHHLSENICPTVGAKIEQNQGVLLISDNFELLSRIWRTAISKTHLWEFVSTYVLAAGQFKKVEPNKKKKVSQDDGSLPWIGFYRAARILLPEEINKKPEIIIVDLLPFRHRGRAKEIIAWAKSVAKYVIVISALYDEETYRVIKEEITNIVPIDKTISSHLIQMFNSENNITDVNPVTASWSTLPLCSYLNKSLNDYRITGFLGITSYEEKIVTTLELFSHCYLKDRTMSKDVKRLYYAFLSLISQPIPLTWYENLLLNDGKKKLIDQIDSSGRIPGDTKEESNINRNMIPILQSEINEIYALLAQSERSPKGEAICSIVLSNIGKKILIICPAETVVSEIKVWIRLKTKLNSSDLLNITVVSQSEWARNQIREIYRESEENPNIIVLVSPWKSKYISSFYVLPDAQVYALSFKYEEALYKSQFRKILQYNTIYMDDFCGSFHNLFDCNIGIEQINNETIQEYYVKEFISLPILTLPNSNKLSEENLDITHLFDNDAFLRMVMSNDEENTQDSRVNADDLIDIDVINRRLIADPDEEKQTCIKLQYTENESLDTYNIFIPEDELLKILRTAESDLFSFTPLELLEGDLWIRLRHLERRELFESVLSLASNSMTMKWINHSVGDWREMIRLLWEKYHIEGEPKKHTYERILKVVKEMGGTVETTYTISNWIKGEVSAIKDERNVRAVAMALDDPQFISRWKVIYNAMRRLWNIHIQLGKTLARIITQYAVKKFATHEYFSEWVDLGMDIRIPVDDILSSISILNISNIEKNVLSKVPKSLIQIPLKHEQVDMFNEKGWIINESYS